MKLTAVFEPASEGGFTCYVKEIPEAISEGDTLDEARANLLDALDTVFSYRRQAQIQGENAREEELVLA